MMRHSLRLAFVLPVLASLSLLAILARPVHCADSPADIGATDEPKVTVQGANPTSAAVRPAKSAKIEKEELLGHIQYLAAPEFRGREAGTPDQVRAAQYIAGEFQRYGLAAAGDEKDGQRTYFQEFPLKSSKGYGKASELKLARTGKDGKEIRFELGKQFAPFPAGAEKAEAAGGVAFAGYGIVAPEIPYDDFGELDLAGKWALILRFEPQEKDDKSKFGGKDLTHHSGLAGKVSNCLRRRAVGVLIATGPAGHEKDAAKLTDGAGALMGDFSAPVLQITPAAADEILAPSGKSLAQLQAAIDKDLSHQAFVIPDSRLEGRAEIKIEARATRNVLALLEGSDEKLKREWVVIGAHCDHVGVGNFGSLLGKEGKGKVHPGADDNASGTAGLLEIAQHAGSLKPAERPRRSLLFMAFTGEETGLLGSQYFLDHPKVPLKDIAAMVNLDMIGRSEEGKVQVAGVGSSKGFKDLVRKYSDPKIKVSMGSAGNGPSDHASFFNKKIPVLFFFTGLHADYHRPSDTWDKINAPVAQAISEMAGKVLFDIASDPARPEFLQAPSGGYLGVTADGEKKGAKGYAVKQVAAGGPAEQAGLKAGDLIVSVNGQKVGDAGDLGMALIDFGPGDEVRIAVERDAKKIEIPVKLGTRSKKKN